MPPSKTIKKVDCGGWNHPDSEENTRTTVYGKIGMACLDRKKSSSDQHWGEPGTGFDDDTPPNRTHFWNLARTDRDDDDFKHADPYVCWNKHLYKAYVGWNLAAAYLFLGGFLLVKANLTGPRPKKPRNGWNTVNYLVQVTCLVEALVSYYILTSKTMGHLAREDTCNFFILATMPLSKTVAFPGVQEVDALFRNWEVSDHWLEWDARQKLEDPKHHGL